MVVEMYTHRIPMIYRRFAEQIGEKHWRNRVSDCKQEMRGNPFLRDYLVKENDIAFQLERMRESAEKFQFTSMEIANDSSIYPAAAFSAQVLSILDSRTPQEAERFRRRVHGAFRNTDEGRVPRGGVSPQPGQAEIHGTQRATADSRVGKVSQRVCNPSNCM